MKLSEINLINFFAKLEKSRSSVKNLLELVSDRKRVRTLRKLRVCVIHSKYYNAIGVTCQNNNFARTSILFGHVFAVLHDHIVKIALFVQEPSGN